MAVFLYDQVKWVCYSFVITLFIFKHKHRLLVLNGAVLMYTHVPPWVDIRVTLPGWQIVDSGDIFRTNRQPVQSSPPVVYTRALILDVFSTFHNIKYFSLPKLIYLRYFFPKGLRENHPAPPDYFEFNFQLTLIIFIKRIFNIHI